MTFDDILEQAIYLLQRQGRMSYQAPDVSGRQDAKLLQLRVAANLALLWRAQGRRKDAYDLLVSVYDWFAEGFDTADLQEAKALLAALS